MAVDISNLAEKLNELTGLNFEECEKEERNVGNNAVDVTFSKSFQARLAAKALDVNVWEIKELSLKQYAKVTTTVMTFLFGSADEETKTEKSSRENQ